MLDWPLMLMPSCDAAEAGQVEIQDPKPIPSLSYSKQNSAAYGKHGICVLPSGPGDQGGMVCMGQGGRQRKAKAPSSQTYAG
jgi:hypothetical protein